MDEEEFNLLEKEISNWNKLKAKIKEVVDIVSPKDIDEVSLIFRILKLEKKKDKVAFTKTLKVWQEGVFTQTFNAMNDYFENVLKKDYVKISDIKLFENSFGIIKDRVKSEMNYHKDLEKERVQIKKKIVKATDYDKKKRLELDLYYNEDYLKEATKKVRLLKDIARQLKYDIQKCQEAQQGEQK